MYYISFLCETNVFIVSAMLKYSCISATIRTRSIRITYRWDSNIEIYFNSSTGIIIAIVVLVIVTTVLFIYDLVWYIG